MKKLTLEERQKWLDKNRDRILNHQKMVDKDLYLQAMNDENEKQGWIKHFGYEPKLDDWFKFMETSTIIEPVYLDKPQSCCLEKVCGIDLSDILETIKKDEIEHSCVLLIKDGKIVKKYEYLGKSGNVSVSDEQFEEIAKAAKELNANIYDVHNHPLRIVAHPSHGDINVINKRFRPICEKYGVKIVDWGVVTEFDYYSAKEKGEFN